MWMSFFEIFGNKKCIFWAKTLTERWYLLITEKFLFWTFRWWKIRSFFESRSWWKDDICWLPRSSCFELFGDGKYDLSFREKVDAKVIFTWFFWAFDDIPWPEKYGFSCSVKIASISQFVCAFIYTVVSLRQPGKYILYTLNTLCMIIWC